jgi:LuxR family maltose regulon positive regulatory protein
VGCVIETGTLRALALAAIGEEDRAIGVLAAALTLGHPEGYVRVFADEGEPMRALLGRQPRTEATPQSCGCGGWWPVAVQGFLAVGADRGHGAVGVQNDAQPHRWTATKW